MCGLFDMWADRPLLLGERDTCVAQTSTSMDFPPWQERRLRFRLLTPNVELPVHISVHIYRSWVRGQERGRDSSHSGLVQRRARVSMVLFSSIQSVTCSVCFCCLHGELTPKRADKRRISKSTPPGSLWVSVNHTGTRAFCLLLKV